MLKYLCHWNSSINLKKSLLVTYANELIYSSNQFYKYVQVISYNDEQLKAQRLKLVRAFKIILYIVLETLWNVTIQKNVIIFYII